MEQESVGRLLRFLFLIVICGSFVDVYAEASIAIKVLDFQEKELSVVEVGQPFILKIFYEGFKKKVGIPVIAGLDQIQGKYCGSEQFTSNYGLAKLNHTYRCRIDQVGEYVIGPVVHKEDDVIVQSPEVHIIAQVRATDKKGAHQKKQKKPEAFVDFSVDKQEVVVGQKIECTISFCFLKDSQVTGQCQLNMTSLPGFIVGKESVFDKGCLEIDGGMYRVVEWRWFIYPQEQGVKMIPSYAVDYLVHKADQFSIFNFSYQEQRRVQSNVVHLKVNPLPPTDMPVVGVGQFTDLTVSMVPQQIKEGEGAVLTVALKGDGNSENIVGYTLAGMPDSIKWYESKKYMIAPKKSGDEPVCCFEFVIQALRAGEWVVPEQKFVFFDTEKNMYVTITSDPVLFSIFPREKTQNNDKEEDVYRKKEEESVVSDNDAIDGDSDEVAQLALNSTGPWFAVSEKKAFSLWFFLLLLCVPLIIVLGMVCVCGMRIYSHKYERQLKAKKALVYAQRDLLRCKKEGKIGDLYMICMRFIAQRCMIPEGALSRGWIATMLENKNCSLEYRQEFEHFLDKLSYYCFAQGVGGQIDNDIYAQVEAWIVRLEKTLSEKK